VKLPPPLHRWNVSPIRAAQIQRDLATRVVRTGNVQRPRLIAGADLAFSRDGSKCIAGIVVWDMRAEAIVEEHVVRRPLLFPYVPGLLSFREAPALLAAIRKLRCEPDIFMFDGHGFAHPRRIGLASHVGLFLDLPAIGCAKSLLVGDFKDPATTKGSSSPLTHHGERIGTVLRTRDGVKPVFVSVGHRISLKHAGRIVLQCATRFRLPEPTRLADRLVANAR